VSPSGNHVRAYLDVSPLRTGHHSAVGTVTWDDFARLASAPVALALRGHVAPADDPGEQVLFAPPDLWRVENEQGRLLYLANDAGHYQWRASGGQLACFQERRPGYWHSGGVNSTNLVRPRNLLSPGDDDFTRPVGSVEEVTVIGRPAWRVLLAPPPRKPQPVWQVLDVESGVTLAYQTPDGLTLVGFTSLATGIEIPNGVFAAPTADG
jgi:hypothetical protein